MGKLPKNASIVTKPSGPVDLIQIFLSSKSELETQLKTLKPLLKAQGLLWVTYPKGTSKLKVDINRDIIREYVETKGFKVVAQVAIDDRWSALRLKVT